MTSSGLIFFGKKSPTQHRRRSKYRKQVGSNNAALNTDWIAATVVRASGAKTVTVTTPGAVTTAVTTPTAGMPCKATSLSLVFLGSEGATGHGELGFALRNSGTTACRTYGFPGIQFLSKSGGPLPTVPNHTTEDFFGSSPEKPLVVAPGGQVSFRLGVLHGAASPAGCVSAYGLSVIPPDDTAPLRVSIPDGATECNGTATVSPVQTGTSAFP